MSTQADMNIIESPETVSQWLERLEARAVAGETVVIREGERGLGSATLERVRRQLEHAGARVHVAPARRQGLG